jgi:Mce-associated membrane protein
VKTTTVLQSGENSARVLLFVDQLSSSTQLKTPQVDQSRIVVTVSRSGGRWLVSSLSAV